jgi:hypothetical protein
VLSRRRHRFEVGRHNDRSRRSRLASERVERNRLTTDQGVGDVPEQVSAMSSG